jgi:replicative DNA helicase
MTTFGKSFLAALSTSGSVGDLIHFGAIDHLFKGNEEPVYAFVKEFVKGHGAIPQLETIEAHTGVALAKPAEPATYYFDLMQTRHTEATLKASMKKAADALQPGGTGSDAALGIMSGAVLELMTQKYGNKIADLRQAHEMLMQVYSTHWHGDGERLLYLGWPYLDKMSGGLRRTDLISYVGRPAMGKTWNLLYGALSGYLAAEADPQDKQGSSRMFVSMEMDIVSIEQRLASMVAKIPAAAVKKSAMSTVEMQKFKKGLKMLQGAKAPFWIVDGNLTATVEEVYMLARQLKPDAVFIDGAYLLKNPKVKDRYQRVAENADLLKTWIANEIGPCCCSWQFARSASKKKKGEETDLSDIAYSDAIGQVSSLVLGLFEEESVETLSQRKVKILKGRHGETGEFTTNWRFDVMDFSQVDEKTVEELNFL